jgi:uncharacterized membrane protein YjfL (UPF0719 family)
MFWSIAILRNRSLAVGIGIYGVLLGPAIIIALATGHLTLAKHWFRLVIVAQVVWFIIVGALLWRSEKKVATANQV